MTTRMKTVFVTVGSTKFEPLIETVLSERTLSLLRKFGYRRCILQAGNGQHDKLSTHDSTQFVREGVQVILYRFKSSLTEDRDSADLVISHAGSASIIESLEAGKRLIVVVNEALMDNHQIEMAEKLFDLRYLLFAKPSELDDKIELIENGEFTLEPYKPGNPKLFGNYLNSVIQN